MGTGSINCYRNNATITTFRGLRREIDELVRYKIAGRESDSERNLIHTTGMVAHDSAICHYVYENAPEKGVDIRLPFTGTGNLGPVD